MTQNIEETNHVEARKRIVENLDQIDNLIQSSRKKLQDLTKKGKRSQRSTLALEQTLEKLKTELNKKEDDIVQLRNEVSQPERSNAAGLK